MSLDNKLFNSKKKLFNKSSMREDKKEHQI